MITFIYPYVYVRLFIEIEILFSSSLNNAYLGRDDLVSHLLSFLTSF